VGAPLSLTSLEWVQFRSLRLTDCVRGETEPIADLARSPRRFRLLRIVLGILGVLFLASAGAAEKRINRSDLPPAVERAVAAQGADAVRGFSKETENGQTFYEAELTVNGLSRDLRIDPTGTIVEVEEEVPWANLPAEVRTSLHAAAGAGTLVKVESLTKHDRLVAYEAQIENKGRKSEIQFGPDGQRLGHAE